jgi:elongator complex protein 3
MLALGGTRVEIGVQTPRDDILERINRGHTAADTIEAFRVARDAGLKICAHLMPNLPGATPASDYADFTQIFADPSYRPDMLKIYPTLVVAGTPLYDEWQAGEYEPYDLETLIALFARLKHALPPYVRIQRVQRDIPAQLICAGPTKSNLRELVTAYMRDHDMECPCIRCREEGFRQSGGIPVQGRIRGNPELECLSYEAGGGTEHFLSLTDPDRDALVGYLRLRFPSAQAHRPELQGPVAIVREIRVVGELVVRDQSPTASQVQNRGYGALLLAEAEEISRAAGMSKLAVIAGIGVREWFYKKGYSLAGPFVVRGLGSN